MIYPEGTYILLERKDETTLPHVSSHNVPTQNRAS